MIKCKKCGHENQLGSELCSNCSSQLTTDVFISYSRKDYVDANGKPIRNNIISKIKNSLSAAGISYWFDEDGIYSGDEFASIITRAIRNSTVFLFISSTNSNASRWTSNEIAVAMAFKKPIIPFRIDDSLYNDSVMMKIISLDYIDCKDKDRAVEQLIRGVRHWVPEVRQDVSSTTSHLNIAERDGSMSEPQTASVSAISVLSVEFNEIKKAFASRRMIVNIIEVIILGAFIVSGFVNLFLSFVKTCDIEFFTASTAFSYIGAIGTYRLMKSNKDCLYWLIPIVIIICSFLVVKLMHGSSLLILGALVIFLLAILSLTYIKKEGKSVWDLLDKAPRSIKDDLIYLLMIFVLVIGLLGLIPIYLCI